MNVPLVQIIVRHRKRRFVVTGRRLAVPGRHYVTVEARGLSILYPVPADRPGGRFSSGLLVRVAAQFLRDDGDRQEEGIPSKEISAAGSVPAELEGRTPIAAADARRTASAASGDRWTSRAAGGVPQTRRPRGVFSDRMTAAAGGDGDT